MKTQERQGDWIQTFTGQIFWPIDPRPEEVDILDIAHALSMQCRFGGHCRSFYSVAEHSVRVSYLVSPQHALWGLLHDAAEAYLVDLPSPIKKWSQMGTLYQEIEAKVMAAICIRFRLRDYEPHDVERADRVMLMTEKRDLVQMGPKPWEDTEQPLAETIVPLTQTAAKALFLNQFQRLTA